MIVRAPEAEAIVEEKQPAETPPTPSLAGNAS
jgi:hypothetical protein